MEWKPACNPQISHTETHHLWLCFYSEGCHNSHSTAPLAGDQVYMHMSLWGKIQPSCFGEILEFGYWCGEGIGLHQEGIQSFPPCSYCGCRWPRHRSSKHLLYILNYEVIWCQLNIPKWWTQKILLEKSLKEAWVRARNPTAGGEVSYLSKLAMPLRLT